MYLSTEHGAHHAHADTDGSPYLRWTAHIRASYSALHLKNFCCSVAGHRIATTWFAVLIHPSRGIVPNTSRRDDGYRRLKDHFRRVRHLIGEQGWTSRRSDFTTTGWETLLYSNYLVRASFNELWWMRKMIPWSLLPRLQLKEDGQVKAGREQKDVPLATCMSHPWAV